jgi:hypothetical protein
VSILCAITSSLMLTVPYRSRSTKFVPCAPMLVVPMSKHVLCECQYLAISEQGWAYRNEKIRHEPLVLLPCFAVLCSTFLNVSDGAVNDHTREEEWIEPGEGRIEACHGTP